MRQEGRKFGVYIGDYDTIHTKSQALAVNRHCDGWVLDPVDCQASKKWCLTLGGRALNH